MNDLCGNTQAEIVRDQPATLSREEWEIRHEESQRKLDARKAFIACILANIDVVGHAGTYTLADAISQIEDEGFWQIQVRQQGETEFETLDQIFADDPDHVVLLFISGQLDRSKSLIQHEVEKLADCVRF